MQPRYWTRVTRPLPCWGAHAPEDLFRIPAGEPALVRVGHLHYCQACAWSHFQARPPVDLPALPAAARPSGPVAVTEASERSWVTARQLARRERRQLAERRSGQRRFDLAPEADVRMRQAGRD